ncbi:radical SAM peptide maturase, CXXX-repeat target family [Dehalobacter sp. TBBPA1]|uniref:radical SAM peptide maturase, CXXX-repeat target family n=1 Tax=Dehalobacter sp. TBBPA1 TaxID=3235037 RepID=UPI0034A18A1A
MNLPSNGYYLTSKDFMDFQDYFITMYDGQNCSEGCDRCLSTLLVKTITFVVTERCNLNCSYCYETHKSGKVMTKDIAKKAVDFILNKRKLNGYIKFNDSPAVILEFIGGEPLLEIDLIDYIVDYFRFRAFELGISWADNYMVSITSNGILFDTPKVQSFLRKNKGRVSLGITIDGNRDLHDACRRFPDGRGSYDIVESAVKKGLKLGIQESTKMTISPTNVMYLSAALQNLWGLGLRGAYANCIYEEGWTIEHAKILFDEMIKLADFLLKNKNFSKYWTSLFDETIGQELIEDKNWCGGNGEMLAIGTDGKLYPCIRFMQYSLSTPCREEKSIGSIETGILLENEWLEQLKRITMSSQSEEKCNTCPIASGCSLCTGYNYDKFGDPNKRATYICIMHQARVLANRYFFKRLYNLIDSNKEFKLNVPEGWALNIIQKKEYLRLCGDLNAL